MQILKHQANMESVVQVIGHSSGRQCGMLIVRVGGLRMECLSTLDPLRSHFSPPNLQPQQLIG